MADPAFGDCSVTTATTVPSITQCSGPCSSVQVFQDGASDGFTECINIHDLAQPSTPLEPSSSLYNYSLAGNAGVSIIMASAHDARTCDNCKEAFTRAFSIPDFWWDESCKRANGYFGFEEFPESGPDGRERSGCASWSRLQVKSLWPDPKKPEGYSYGWDKLDIFSRWFKSTKHTVVIFFQAKRSEGDAIEAARKDTRNRGFRDSLFRPRVSEEELKDPFWIYPRLLREFTDLVNDSVWQTRTLVRDRVEKVRERREAKNREEQSEEDDDEPEPLNPDYSLLHDIARHVIHVSETLKVGAVTVESMQRRHDMYFAEGGRSLRSRNISNVLSFQHHMMTSNLYRSEANWARLRNEISLAFNQVSQADSNVSVQIAKDTRLDSAAMRTIAFVTMIFLPATFISAIFSTSFFNYSPETGHWRVSEKFYVYWIVAGTVTGAMIGLWFWKRSWFEPAPIKTGRRLNSRRPSRRMEATAEAVPRQLWGRGEDALGDLFNRSAV